MFRSTYPDAKLTAREYTTGFIFAVLILKFGPFFITFFADINQMLVKMALSIVLGRYPDAFNTGFIDAIYDPETGLIGDAIIAFIAAFSVGVINWQYAMRKLTIAALLAILPVTLVISIFPSRREAISIWIKEMTANVFLQAAHAFVIAFMILFLRANETSSGSGLISQTFIMHLAMVMGLTTLTSLVRRVIGAESMGSGAMGMVGTGLGFAGIAAMGRIMSRGLSRGKQMDLNSAAGSTGSNDGPINQDAGNTSKKVPFGESSFARKGTAFAGRTAGKVAGLSVRTGIAGVGALAGSMIGGATTGSNTAGSGAGALIADSFGGQRLGGFIGEQTAGVVEATGNAGLYGMKVAAGGLNGTDQANADLGMTTEGIKYNPELAKEAGTKILGNNLPGKALGAGLSAAAGNRLANNPGLSSGVKGLNQNITNSRARLEEIQQTAVPQAQSRLDIAKANFTEAKNMYSPKSEAMKKLDPESTEYQQNIEKFNLAKGEMESSEATYAKLQKEQMQLTQAIEQNSIHEQMKELVNRNQSWSGGRLGNEWSH
ncbi:hypothetical protein N752_01060 [Desulforamulus aquiferis]|nr:hypothetical protein [Desulforamulus aquiferis]RYD07204.1 hypothetical protein N752_01060 [Desulforamulus aquiferis]